VVFTFYVRFFFDQRVVRHNDQVVANVQIGVGAFVLAGLDPHVGAEADFFADRVRYYTRMS
jgi:hypothetical protein